MLRVFRGSEDIADLREWLHRHPRLALDTETTGVDIYSPTFRVRILQFGSTNEAWVVPMPDWAGLANELIGQYRGRWTLHNSRFDIEALATCGVTVPWHAVDDTMIAIRIAEPHRTAGLKDAATRHVSAAAKQGQTELHKAMRANGWDWATVPLDFYPYIFYGAMDTVLTARLAEVKIIREAMATPIYRMEMEVREISTEMERRGMRVDLDFARVKREALLAEADNIKSMCSDFGLDVMSPAQLGRWLLDQGVRLTHVTAGGSPSTSKESLEDALPSATGLARDVIAQSLRARKILKLANTYYQNFIEMSVDGLLHPSIETIAAKTGRASIRNPALQTLPRVGDDPDASDVRNAIIPRNEGEVLMSCDFSQIELRCIANFSGDEGLQAAFHKTDEEGGDFFTNITREVYGDPSISKGDSRRNLSKTLLYAFSYGAGITKLARGAGVSEDEMRDVSDRVLGRYPGIKKLMKAAERAAAENDNWIVTPAGRKIWIDPDRGYKALNGLIQAHAADVFKRATVDLASAGLAEFFVLPIHDEILLSVPEEFVPEAQRLLSEIMPDRSMAVPLTAEPSDGYARWGQIPK